MRVCFWTVCTGKVQVSSGYTYIVAYCTSGAASVACSGRPYGLAWVHRPPLRDMWLGAHTDAVDVRTYRMCAGVRGYWTGIEVGLEVITTQIVYPIYASS